MNDTPISDSEMESMGFKHLEDGSWKPPMEMTTPDHNRKYPWLKAVGCSQDSRYRNLMSRSTDDGIISEV